MLFVAAAGNDGFNNDVTPTYPATYASDAVLAVAATDHNDGLAFFSSYGAKTVDLGAPGVGILSTTPGNSYGSFDGTSMATPHVAGAAALVEDRFPGATLYGIKALLMNSVDPAAALAGKTVTGGRLNIGNALACDNQAKVVLSAPANGFVAGVNDVIPIKVLGANCAVPAGIGNVMATVNGTPVALSAASPDTGLYTGSYAVNGPGALTVTATRDGRGLHRQRVGERQRVSELHLPGRALLVGRRHGCSAALRRGWRRHVLDSQHHLPVPVFRTDPWTAFVSSNGFLALGSSAGATALLNVAHPDDRGSERRDRTVLGRPPPGRDGFRPCSGQLVRRTALLYVEWFNVPHFTLSSSGTVTFEAIMKQNGDIRYQYLDTTSSRRIRRGTRAHRRPRAWSASDGVVGRQMSFNQPLLTNGRAVSCTFGAPPPPPPVPTITTTSLPGGTVGRGVLGDVAGDERHAALHVVARLGLAPGRSDAQFLDRRDHRYLRPLPALLPSRPR